MGGLANSDWGCLPSLGSYPLQPDTHRGSAISAHQFWQPWTRSRNCNKPVKFTITVFCTKRKSPGRRYVSDVVHQLPLFGRKAWGSKGYTFQANQVLRDSWSPGFGKLVHSGEPDYFYDSANFSQPWGVGQMGHYHPVAEEQFWSQPEKVWKRNCLGPTAVSQGEGSLHIEHLSHSGHDANQDSEWGACGVTRPKPAAQLVTENRFELLAEEPETSTSSLTATTNQVEAQAPSTCATVPQSSAGSRKPKKTSQQKRRNAKRQLSEQAADQTVHPELHLWQELRQLLSQDVQFPMIAQEAQLVAWAEKHESAIPEGTLRRWTIEHMLTLLARGEMTPRPSK